mgnify:FL=1
MAKYAAKIVERLSVGLSANSSAVVKEEGAALLTLLSELDDLLGSSQGFLFGKWLADSERHGTSAEEKELMRWNAKTQVTFWECVAMTPVLPSACIIVCLHSDSALRLTIQRAMQVPTAGSGGPDRRDESIQPAGLVSLPRAFHFLLS